MSNKRGSGAGTVPRCGGEGEWWVVMPDCMGVSSQTCARGGVLRAPWWPQVRLRPWRPGPGPRRGRPLTRIRRWSSITRAAGNPPPAPVLPPHGGCCHRGKGALCPHVSTTCRPRQAAISTRRSTGEARARPSRPVLMPGREIEAEAVPCPTRSAQGGALIAQVDQTPRQCLHPGRLECNAARSPDPPSARDLSSRSRRWCRQDSIHRPAPPSGQPAASGRRWRPPHRTEIARLQPHAVSPPR
jgi:hypothetical protein